ncbi:LacI family DNA-binding transcriptional regulator [Paracoccus siganidrum]|uniref:LacI family DNA-binding transcriptional regulator n=1 Tax=Paracoccus siganidrum TaxID=1276757 RepID=A0A419ACG5_9RHOB|nr:LacI family DNA-binding transcriptional regulator [Paracoccus siganidrum]RJL22639.1 LacI family DNA-binding transcriptional regulator [Paracoccus siganidrum]RMC39709.1 LacI family transcriptional regulator [Paracoccus siganidrum]
MAGKNITSVDVARHAGVSQSAVSRYFTPGASVSAKMADKIRAAADELGYRPNVLARSLITGKSRIIGLVVYYLENQFYPEAVEKLSVALQESGYHVLLFMASHTVGDVEPVMQQILDYQVDGIIMVSVSISSVLAQRCAELSIPVMLFNRDQPDLDLMAVTTDNMRGGTLAAQTLLEAKPRRIAHLAGFEGASTQIDREAGFLRRLAAEGYDLHARAVGNFHYAEAVEATHELFDRPDPPDALFVTDDHMAFAAMDVIRHEFRLRIPEDVAVIGFDDVPLASWPSFNLTTMRQHVNQMVSKAVSELLTAIEEPEVLQPVKLRIPPTLIRRGTTRPPA